MFARIILFMRSLFAGGRPSLSDITADWRQSKVGCKRIAPHGITGRVFSERPDKTIVHTPAGQHIRVPSGVNLRINMRRIYRLQDDTWYDPKTNEPHKDQSNKPVRG